ncbi:MAG: DEAD/DEAH box helicase, partial [Planctomycetaceae bacterium]
MSFSELGLSDPILRAIQTEGYTAPTPIQAQSIPHVMEGRDLLGSAQTGTGKTAAFALPILHRLIASGNPPAGSGRKIRVLVLAPTRELAVQIGENFSAYGRNTPLRSAVIFGGVGQGAQVEALRRGIDILIATPGRLNDLIGQGYVDLRHVKIFVLDEADRMLDVGFLPDIRRVITHLPAQRQTLFFSATMPTEVRRLADDLLTNPAKVEIAPVKSTAELIDQMVCHVPKGTKTRLLAGFLKTKGVRRSIVFARTKHGADKIVRQLFLFGIRGEAIHGNTSQNARQRTLDRFRTGKVVVLVATDLAARGIDVDDITHVFNFDLPHEPETYVHRIGRTGRAGATGQAIAFCDPSERGLLKSIERLMRKTIAVCDDLPVPSAPTDEERESLEK